MKFRGCFVMLVCFQYTFVFFVLVGESGLGKSTLVRSLFLTNLFGNKTCPPAIGKGYLLRMAMSHTLLSFSLRTYQAYS